VSKLVALLCLAVSAFAQCQTSEPREVLIWKIWYGDGSVKAGHSFDDWVKMPSKDVQVLAVFYRDTYRIFHEPNWDVEHYRTLLHSTDYYWFDGKQFGAGGAPDTLKPSPDGAVKLGKWMTNRGWEELILKVQAEVNP